MLKKIKKWLSSTPDLNEYMRFYKLAIILSIVVLIIDAIAELRQ